MKTVSRSGIFHLLDIYLLPGELIGILRAAFLGVLEIEKTLGT